MGHQYAAIAFTEQVKQVQQEQKSRANYAGLEQGEDVNNRLSQREAGFIQQRDSFYMASVGETGWPYVQHRGGPTGFMRVIDDKTIGFADFTGNRQYISTGNFRSNDRVSIIFMDYPNRTRMKVLGRIRVVTVDDAETLSQLEIDDYRANIERGFLIDIEAFDWNCPQHITPRYTDEYIQQLLEPLQQENNSLKQTCNQFRSDNSALQVASGNGPMELIISGIRQLTPRVRAFELRDPQGLDLPAVSAGSHLKVPVQLANGEQILRHYSICSNPARRDMYEIAVLKENHPGSGSTAVHEQYQLGKVLHCELPDNHFVLHDDDRPAVLIAGGIGITPIKAMAQTLSERNTPLSIHYAGRSESEMPFRDRLQREFNQRIQIYSSADNNRLNIIRVLSSAPINAVFYICGPNRLIDSVTEAAKDQAISPERIRFERFTSSVGENAKPVKVVLQRSNKILNVPAHQTILDSMLEAGIATPFSCKTGNCKSCAVKVLEGSALHRDSALSKVERIDYQLMCPCISRSASEVLVLDI